MSYTQLPSTIIEAGDPVTQTLWSTYVRDNQINHESRIASLESGGATVSYMPQLFTVKGPLQTQTDVGFIRLPFDITVLAGRLVSQTAGSGGTTTIDFQYKRGAGSWTTIFSAKPSITSTSDYQTATGTLSVTALLSGDLVRMNIDSIQAGKPYGLLGVLEFEKT